MRDRRARDIGVVRPADPWHEQRLVRSMAPALVSAENLGLATSPRAHLSIGAVLARVGGPRTLYGAVLGALGNSGHLKRGQLPADRPVNASCLPRMPRSAA